MFYDIENAELCHLIISPGTIWVQNQGHRAAVGCGHGDVPRGGAIWTRAATARIERDRTTFIHYEGMCADLIAIQSQRNRESRFAICPSSPHHHLHRRSAGMADYLTPSAFVDLQVKLPAEQEDWQKRPAYIKENNAGVYICENRYAR